MPVLVSNSRGPDSLTELVGELGDAAQAVTVEQAAKADVVILALPFVRVPELADIVPDWTGGSWSTPPTNSPSTRRFTGAC